MAKKKKKKTTGYVDKPSFERYKKAIKKSKPSERKHLYKIQKGLDSSYEKQEAKIKLGVIPTKRQTQIRGAREKVSGYVSKSLSGTMSTKVKFRKPVSAKTRAAAVRKVAKYMAEEQKKKHSILGEKNIYFKSKGGNQ